MATNILFNNVTYSVPAEGDTGWGPDLSAYFISIASNAFQKSGGTFTLTAEANFGATYGLKSVYYKSSAANPASAGALRLGNTQGVYWRNNANNADIGLVVTAGDALQFNSANVIIAGLGSIVNADVNAAAAIAYSKLNLSASIVNADIAVGAAIAYSKLNLATSIVNADIAGAAAIAYSKLAALTASRLLVSDGSGVVSVSAVTSTEAAYLSGMTVTAGGVAYTDGTTIKNTGAGTSGYLLKSNGAGAPTWQENLTTNLVTVSSAPASGKIGEQLISSVLSQSVPTSGDFGDVTSLSLTAGVWDISVYGSFGQGGANATGALIGISSTFGNSSIGLTAGLNRIDFQPPNAAAWQAACIPAYRVVVASTTTYYFKVSINYTSTAPITNATMKAVRVA